MCFRCVQQVNTSYNFKAQCETADATLKQIVGCLPSQMTIQVQILAHEQVLFVQCLIHIESCRVRKESILTETISCCLMRV